MDEYKGKLVLITGGSSGIGLALAKQFSNLGADVWVIARNRKTLGSALVLIESEKTHNDQKFGFIGIDVSKHDYVNYFIEKFIKTHGVPDVLINSAGVAHPGNFLDLDIDIFHWMMDINYFGTVNVIKAIIPGMLSRGSGHIVNISSIAGFLGVYGYSAYGASKYAVRGFTDVLRSELKPHRIDVSIVFPPDTDTPQLQYENQYKPAVTKALAGTSNPLSPDVVAKDIIKGISKKRYLILPGFESKIIYILNNNLGKLIYKVIDILIKNILHKQKINSQH